MRTGLSTTRVALACACVAIVTAAIASATVMSVADWNVTVLVRMAAEQQLAPLARETDPGFAFVHFDGRGDGAYYYAIARDPLARGDAHTLFVWPAYRYGHPGLSWAAWLLTAGNAALVPFAFLLLNLAGMGVAAAGASFIARDLGHSPWGGLTIALNPGLVYATTIDTSEPLAAGLLALALLAWLRGRRALGLIPLAALCFMKEWFVLVPLGLAVWELLQLRRVGRRAALGRVAAIAASVVPFGAWYVYVIVRFGGWPAAPAGDLIQLPLTGWAQTARRAADIGTGTFDGVVVGHLALPLLAVFGLAFVLGIARAARFRSPIDPVYLAFMPVVLGLNWFNLLYAKDLIRTTAIPLALLSAVLVAQRWRGRESTA